MLHSLPATLAAVVVDGLVARHELVRVPSVGDDGIGRWWRDTRGMELIYAALVSVSAGVDRHLVVAASPAGHLVVDAVSDVAGHRLRVELVPSGLAVLDVRPTSRGFVELTPTVQRYADEWSRLVS